MLCLVNVPRLEHHKTAMVSRLEHCKNVNVSKSELSVLSMAKLYIINIASTTALCSDSVVLSFRNIECFWNASIWKRWRFCGAQIWKPWTILWGRRAQIKFHSCLQWSEPKSLMYELLSQLCRVPVRGRSPLILL